MVYKTCDELIRGIDFPQLREQKRLLVGLQAKATAEENEAIEGLLSMIDSIQDTAFVRFDLAEEDVYTIEDGGSPLTKIED